MIIYKPAKPPKDVYNLFNDIEREYQAPILDRSLIWWHKAFGTVDFDFEGNF